MQTGRKPKESNRRFPEGWTPCREDLAWAAGFMDGEGSWPYSQRGLPEISVGQSGSDVLPRRLHRILGVGNVYGPYRRKRPVQDVYRYSVHGYEQVQAVTALLWPWLGETKRTDATRVLVRFRDAWKPSGWYWREQTECKNGHPYNEANTKIVQRTTGAYRVCLQCKRDWNRNRRRK